MSRKLLVATLAAVALGSGCSAVTPAAAIVNGHKISESELQNEIDRVRDDPSFQELVRRQGDEFRGEARRNILTNFIKVELRDQEARKLGVNVGDKQIDAFLEDLRRRLGGQQAFQQLLKTNNLTLERAKVLAARQLLDQELQTRVTRRLKVDDAKVREYYDRNQQLFSQVHLARITVRSQEEAQQTLDALNGGADFAATARQRSLDPAKDEGGDLGWQDAAQLDAAVAAQLEPVTAGGLAGPIRGLGGFEIYKVLERRAKPLTDVRAQIVDQLLAQDRKNVYTRWLDDKLRKARVVVNPKYGRFDRSGLTVVAAGTKLPK